MSNGCPDLATESATDEAQSNPGEAPFNPSERFKVACNMLRKAGKLDYGRDLDPLPGQKRGESPIDWLVRLGLAPSPHTAAEMLILANGLQHALDELTGSKFEWME